MTGPGTGRSAVRDRHPAAENPHLRKVSPIRGRRRERLRQLDFPRSTSAVKRFRLAFGDDEFGPAMKYRCAEETYKSGAPVYHQTQPHSDGLTRSAGRHGRYPTDSVSSGRLVAPIPDIALFRNQASKIVDRSGRAPLMWITQLRLAR